MNQEYQILNQGPNEVVPSVHRLDTEVVAVAKRRQFSSAYKRRIVREAAACDALGAIGALLRREGLYSSHLATWRRELAAAEHVALSPKRRGPKVDASKAEARRMETLEREVRRLRHKLNHAEHIIAAQKKLCELLGLPAEEDLPR
jgi:transposase-like protein